MQVRAQDINEVITLARTASKKLEASSSGISQAVNASSDWSDINGILFRNELINIQKALESTTETLMRIQKPLMELEELVKKYDRLAQR